MLRTSAFARLLLILTSVSLAAQVQLPKTPVREVTEHVGASHAIDASVKHHKEQRAPMGRVEELLVLGLKKHGPHRFGKGLGDLKA